MWISGLEAVKRKAGHQPGLRPVGHPVLPLRGSGYIEGTLFPWTMSDFSLMDAIECGIVKAAPACLWPTTSPAGIHPSSAISGTI